MLSLKKNRTKIQKNKERTHGMSACSGGEIEQMFGWKNSLLCWTQYSDTDLPALTPKINTLVSPLAKALQISLSYFTRPPQQGRRATEAN